MPKSYGIANTTKVQHEKYVSDAVSISVFDTPEPSFEIKRLVRCYVDGKRELADARKASNSRGKTLTQDVSGYMR
jgi:hypothetical protein